MCEGEKHLDSRDYQRNCTVHRHGGRLQYKDTINEYVWTLQVVLTLLGLLLWKKYVCIRLAIILFIANYSRQRAIEGSPLLSIYSQVRSYEILRLLCVRSRRHHGYSQLCTEICIYYALLRMLA